MCELLTAAPPPAILLRPMQRVLGWHPPRPRGAAAVLGRRICSVCAAGRASVRCGAHYAAGCCTLQVLGCCSGPGFVIGCVGGALLGMYGLAWCCTRRRSGRIWGRERFVSCYPTL
ncbi:hypothetical protein NIA69_14045 [Gemmiger formicilis]|nr:hypothetical protein [Gemmiger formicilis]